jgi:hypothetical protein
MFRGRSLDVLRIELNLGAPVEAAVPGGGVRECQALERAKLPT